MAGISIFGVKLTKGEYEQEVDRCFQNYQDLLSKQKSKIMADIKAWEDYQTRLIQQHGELQKELLNQQYEETLAYLKQQHEDFIDELDFHKKNKKMQDIQQLLDACKTLKFELSALIRSPLSTNFIYVQQPKSADAERNTTTSLEYTDKSSRQNPLINQSNQLKSTNDALVHSLLPETFADCRETIDNPSTMNPSDENRRFMNSEKDQSVYNTRNDNLLEKCPVCFMIFPPNMIEENRHQHVKEHYIDE